MAPPWGLSPTCRSGLSPGMRVAACRRFSLVPLAGPVACHRVERPVRCAGGFHRAPPLGVAADLAGPQRSRSRRRPKSMRSIQPQPAGIFQDICNFRLRPAQPHDARCVPAQISNTGTVKPMLENCRSPPLIIPRLAGQMLPSPLRRSSASMRVERTTRNSATDGRVA